jgi:hypothetical protein
MSLGEQISLFGAAHDEDLSTALPAPIGGYLRAAVVSLIE